jgi:hypothetical protein
MDSLWGPLIVGVLLFLWGYGDMISGSHKIASRARDQLHKERSALPVTPKATALAGVLSAPAATTRAVAATQAAPRDAR